RLARPAPPVASLPPARRARRGDLLSRMPVQIFLRREQDENLLIVISLAHQQIEPLDAFIPPMAEQFGVVGRENQRRPVHDAGQPLKLLEARDEEMTGVF